MNYRETIKELIQLTQTRSTTEMSISISKLPYGTISEDKLAGVVRYYAKTGWFAVAHRILQYMIDNGYRKVSGAESDLLKSDSISIIDSVLEYSIGIMSIEDFVACVAQSSVKAKVQALKTFHCKELKALTDKEVLNYLATHIDDAEINKLINMYEIDLRKISVRDAAKYVIKKQDLNGLQNYPEDQMVDIFSELYKYRDDFKLLDLLHNNREFIYNLPEPVIHRLLDLEIGGHIASILINYSAVVNYDIEIRKHLVKYCNSLSTLEELYSGDDSDKEIKICFIRNKFFSNKLDWGEYDKCKRAFLNDEDEDIRLELLKKDHMFCKNLSNDTSEKIQIYIIETVRSSETTVRKYLDSENPVVAEIARMKLEQMAEKKRIADIINGKTDMSIDDPDKANKVAVLMRDINNEEVYNTIINGDDPILKGIAIGLRLTKSNFDSDKLRKLLG